MSEEHGIQIAELEREAPHTRGSMEQQREAQEDTLEDFERGDGRLPFILNMAELKLLGIAGVGFFLDGMFLT